MKGIWQAYVQRSDGQLPYAVIVNGVCWGIFREEREAVRYLGELTGIDTVDVWRMLRGLTGAT